MSMRAVLLRGFGGVEQLYMGSVARPKLGKDGVLVRVRAAGVNRADIVQRTGKYPPPPGESEILGLEVAGEVAEVESNSSHWRVGDKVMGLIAGGGYAEYAVVPAPQLMKIPKNYNFVEAAAIPEAYLAAYQALEDVAHISQIANASVMIHAAGSGVGTSAIQICKHLKVNPIIATAGSAEKLEFCKKLGATHGINYKTESFKEKVAQITNKKGVSVIMDFVAASYWNDNLKSLATGGVMTIQGGLGGWKVENADLSPLLIKRLSILGTTLRSRDNNYKAKLVKDFMTVANPLFESGEWKPIVDKIFKWDQVVEAHQYMENNQNIGKVILTVD